jgi:NAD(P)-dependent dehydrogenase (short-subunit alcohol dehydrogenase family)
MMLENKTAAIYGGGAIGGAVARAFADAGARVYLAGQSRARPRPNGRNEPTASRRRPTSSVHDGYTTPYISAPSPPYWASASGLRVKEISIQGSQVTPSSDRSHSAAIDARSGATVSVDLTRAVVVPVG